MILVVVGLIEEVVKREGFEVIVGWVIGFDRYLVKFEDILMVMVKFIFFRDRGVILGV